MEKQRLNSMNIKELEKFFYELGQKKYRAGQYFENVHKNHIFDIEKMTNFSLDLREKLKEKAEISKARIVKKIESKLDDTKKYLIQYDDGNIVESVFMKYKTHTSVCLSSQVGCKMGCEFCASTKNTYRRNLLAEEICYQIYLIEYDLGIRVSNLVLMGIGEPLDNYENVSKFLEIISSDKGHNMSKRSISLSTCGLYDKIKRLADDDFGINLTISLHNPFNEEREKLMPVTRKYPLNQVLEACDYYFEKTKRRVSFEYTLIEGVNDSQKYKDELVRLLKDRNCLLNLISLNPIDEFKEKSPARKDMEDFLFYMNKNGVNTTIRRKQGLDIDGACGQLRINNMYERGV